jgi:hypothetical protein
MKALEVTNVVTAFVVLGLLLALFSPLADPARLSVNDQMARIEAGKVSADKVDYRFLRFDGQRYGDAALKGLVKKGGEVGERAAEALARKDRWADVAEVSESAPGNPSSLAPVGAAGKVVPESFLKTAWDTYFEERLNCSTKAPCPVVFLDLNSDGQDELVIGGRREALVFTQAEDTKWWLILSGDIEDCPGTADALRAGRVRAETAKWRDLIVDGKRLALTDNWNGCRSIRPAPPPTP